MKIKIKKNIGTIILAVTAGLLVFLSIYGWVAVLVNFAFHTVISPMLGAANRMAVRATQFYPGFSDYQLLRDENRRLLSEKADPESLRRENEALKRALAISVEIQRKTLPVSSIGFFRNIGEEIIMIDRGQESGVALGDPVINSEKVYVGRVVSVAHGRADVLLLTSSSQTIDVSLLTTETKARAQGLNGREFLIDLVPEYVAVEKGDLFVTSAKIGDAPLRLLIGEVRQVKEGSAAVFKNIRAIHLFDPFRPGGLFVILSNSRF